MHAWSRGSSGRLPLALIQSCWRGGRGSSAARSIGVLVMWRASIGRSRLYQVPRMALYGSMRCLDVGSESGAGTTGVGDGLAALFGELANAFLEGLRPVEEVVGHGGEGEAVARRVLVGVGHGQSGRSVLLVDTRAARSVEQQAGEKRELGLQRLAVGQ